MTTKQTKCLNLRTDSRKYVIGIDPDVDKSGVCFYDMDSKVVEAASLTFPQLLDYLRWFADNKSNDCKVKVVVEAGWVNKAHWHMSYKTNNRVAASIGNATGRNHETGRKIVECAKHYGFDVVEQKPFEKHWHGTDGKITQEELTMVMNGMKIQPLTSRVNQDVRDATLIAIVYGERAF